MTEAWQAGKTYVPGDICRPTAAAAPATVALNNPGFDTGDLTGWHIDSGTWAANGTQPYNGSWCARASQAGVTFLTNTARATVTPGLQVSASCMVRITNTSVDDNGGAICLAWFDNTGTQIGSPIVGTIVSGIGGSWKPSTVTASAPTGAATVTVTLGPTIGTHAGIVDFDQVTWTYAYAGPLANLIYKATQAAPGKSGATEPAWPGVPSVPVTDNQVTWDGELATRIVWQASPLMTSGNTEPTWPTEAGSAVRDGTINWIGASAQITDPNCPQSKIVAIGAGKIFAADNDIVRYCATVNPLDWTAPNDAGYLPTGLQTYGSNPAAAMGLYRSNLVVYNAEGFQMWQLDPDPANIALLDALPVASTHNPALAPTANDLFFLSSQGVRSMGISSAGVNLEAGDVGMPIDALIKPALTAAIASGIEPIGTYIPAMGQFWLSFANYPASGNSQVFVYSINVPNAPGKWSYYNLPLEVSDFTQLNETLYIRGGDDVLIVDDTVLYDYVGRPSGAGGQVDIIGVVQTPYIDLGSPGVEKMLVGFDSVNLGTPSVQMGYDEYNLANLTVGFTIPADTIPGMIIPLPIASPSFSLKLTFPAGAPWKMMSANFYTMRFRVGA
jgi:hypothetical protein